MLRFWKVGEWAFQNNILDVWLRAEVPNRIWTSVVSFATINHLKMLGFWKSEWAFQNNILDFGWEHKFQIGFWIKDKRCLVFATINHMKLFRIFESEWVFQKTFWMFGWETSSNRIWTKAQALLVLQDKINHLKCLFYWRWWVLPE